MYIPGVDKLIGRLEDVLAKEAELIWHVPGEVKDFKAELENMQAFLIDHADQGEMQAQFAEEVEKKWVADIRDKAYEAEDIIDEFTYHMNKHHHDDISCLSWFLQLVIDAPTTLWVMHQTAHKLQKIRKSIRDNAERHTRYKAAGEVSAHDAAGRTHTRKYRQHEEMVKNLRESACFIKEKSIIGFHKETETVKQWLLMDTEPLRAAISVFGMGGAGKTTLISRIYEKQRGGFDLSAWITVSQTYTVKELLRSLIGKFDNAYRGEKESYRELVETLRDCLSGKRYLIVLDDVWDTDLWMQMEVALPEDGVGSRILVTTRDERHAPSPSDVKSYKLPIGQLQGNEPWDLFSMKAFADHPNKTCPEKLRFLAEKLVDKCSGLPLALVTLGGHMSRRKEHEWTIVHDRLYKSSAMDVVKSILRLSYNDLPYSLKHCFLYCCLFPEDYPIKRTRLIRRWIAEGFVEGGDEITPEEEAESYLSELVFRSMLLVETRNVSGRPKVIKMHDVMRDFALEIAKKEKFCGVCDGRETINEFEAYRWSIQFQIGEELKLPGSDMSRVRSLSLFGNSPSFSREHLLKFKMLRLLDLEDREQVSELADEVGNLFNLRYLMLRVCSIKKLPSSIGRLLNLQTLDILGMTDELPEAVGELRNLRHLIMRTYFDGIRMQFDISKLNKLQVLVGVRIDKGETLRQVGTLTQLTTLDIYYDHGTLTQLPRLNRLTRLDHETLTQLTTQLTRLDIFHVHHDGGDLEERRKNWEALGQLKLLHCFTLKSRVYRDINDFIILPLNLKKIYLYSEILVRFQSRWFDSLHNIQHMTLNGCTVSGDQLTRIAALENLVSLEISDWYDVKRVLHFCGGFAKLKQLYLSYSGKLKKVIFEKGAMPHMESLCIRCMNLQGIEHLTNLQKLELMIPIRLQDRHEEGIKNWKSKVQHIPTIHLIWVQLKSLALKLVKKCGGLPLALVTLRAHMSSKMQEQEWTDVYANLNWQLSNNPDLNVMKSILMLSFSDLPYLLKHCFLYCCLFLEDYPVGRKRLIRRWIAEGFVEGGNGITAENEADSCLSALVFRSMLLVEKTNDTGRPKVVKMHDVMREFALDTGKKEKFCGIYDEKGGIDEFGAYRLSICRSSTSRSSTMIVCARLPHNMYMSRVRSLSLCCRSMDWLGYGTSGREFLHKFNMLRVLDLQGVDICELAHEVGNLFNLRYLNLRGTNMEKLPNSSGRLFNLHTLDMNYTSIEELPIQVGKLQNLRYLIMKSGSIVSFGISKLNRLQVLTGVFVEGDMCRQLGSLSHLTRLEIICKTHSGDSEEGKENWEALLSSIQNLKLLQHLSLFSLDGLWKSVLIERRSFLSLNLKSLILEVPVKFQSHWFLSLQNVQHMTLHWCTVSGNQLPDIAALPGLTRLKLSHAFEEVELCFCGGFAKLKKLSLQNLSELRKFTIEKGTMPHIESLSISSFWSLHALPEGCEHLKNLQKLELNVLETLKHIYKKRKQKLVKGATHPHRRHYVLPSSGS